ncbi:uncharacterized protein LOC101858272 [Aplysia californica]|uniref:Uncharacterized protein LOC101858272 n=1 Tax=Aplysia californica TaxID=6500 RepID=A0ABM0JQM9_APLCA|nr:uncharacterized protein LOC101858272 [Aplysia californica]
MDAALNNTTADVAGVEVPVQMKGLGLIDYSTTILLTNIFLYGIWIPIVFSGIVTNIINTVVFVRIGMKDSVNVSFLALSISDLLYLSFNMICLIPSTLTFSGRPTKWLQSPYTLNSYIVWYAILFYDLSILITTYVAITRCCCVTLALKFRSFFTVSRTYTVLGVLSVVCLAFHIPMIASQNLQWQTDKKANTTKLTLVRSDAFPDVQYFHDITNRNVVPYTCLAINITCLAALTLTLQSATQIRNKMAISASTDGNAGKRDSKLSTKDIQVVKAVSLVAAMFVYCSLLTTIKALVRRAIPDYDSRGQYRNLFQLTTGVVTIFTYLNATVNITVYYHFNTKYRQSLIEIFCKGKKP